MSTDQSEKIAYFTMEIAVDAAMPTYAGGLGVLAGDTIRAAADMALPMVAVSLLHRKGYFRQKLDATGCQTESPASWNVEDYLEPLDERVIVTVDDHEVVVRAWRKVITGLDKGAIPVFFLDTDLPENDKWFRTLTDMLYGGDNYYRLCQEVILGIGGIRMLRALGYHNIQRFHMNEGHASLLTLELLEESKQKNRRKRISEKDIEAVRRQCIFTTHTPVEAGHDKFPMEMAARVIGLPNELCELEDVICRDDTLNMTYLALTLSRYVNGVAKRHGEVSREMFGGYHIEDITNGVHPRTWVSPPFAELYDRYIKGWRQDNFSLRYAMSIPREEIWEAHARAKESLIQRIAELSDVHFNPDHLTLGFARRAAPYKRGALPFTNLERFSAIASNVGPIQILYSGKAHPDDNEGKGIIRRIFRARDDLRGKISVAYLPNYDMELAKYIVSGVDIWLNTPQPPLEASGTSGMKAALNGIPSLSILDGWWVEGCIEGVTGWAIDGDLSTSTEGRSQWERDARRFYQRLESDVAPMFYQDRTYFIDIMRNAIALNGSFFTAQRMLQEYVLEAYFP